MQMVNLMASDEPVDTGFTQDGLPLHTDLTYYAQPGGLGFLSCVRYKHKNGVLLCTYIIYTLSYA